MASALTDTVSQYIPTFEKVEAFNIQTLTPASPDGAGAEETSLGHSLVLTQPDDSTSQRSMKSNKSNKSDKMQKKIDFEAGNKAKNNKRVIRNISRTIRPASNNKEQPEKQPPPPTKRTLSRTISIHEINLNNKMNASVTLKSSRTLDVKPALRASNGMRNSAANIKAPERRNSAANLKGSSTLPRIPERKNSTAALKSSSGLPPRVSERKNSSANLNGSSTLPRIPERQDSSSNLQGTRTPRVARLAKNVAELNKNVAELNKTVNSPQLRSAPRSPAMSTRSPLRNNLKSSSSLRSSSGLRSSNGSKSLPVPAGDALGVLLHDFESQKRRAIELSRLEQDIYRQECAKFEEVQQKKKAEQEAAVALANSIQQHETELARLMLDLEMKQKRCTASEEELAAVSKEFEAEVHAHDAEATEGMTTAAVRMAEASSRKSLKAAWKTDPVSQSRFRLLQAQEDIRETQASITVLKKDLGRLKNQASKAKSSDHRLREEMNMRENMRKTGQPKERGSYVRPKGVPKTNEKRAHMSRLDEEKAKRVAAKRATVNVSDLIAAQAGVSRSRYGNSSPYRTVGSASSKGGVKC